MFHVLNESFSFKVQVKILTTFFIKIVYFSGGFEYVFQHNSPVTPLVESNNLDSAVPKSTLLKILHHSSANKKHPLSNTDNECLNC